MNLRILKKLSKRAAPYLAKLGDKREVFPAEKGYAAGLATKITARKHMRRRRGGSTYGDGIVVDAHGRPLILGQPFDALKGTLMIGAVGGGEIQEWYEEDCWWALTNIVFAHYTDWDLMEEWDGKDGPPPRPVITRDLSTPSLIFKAADEMVAELACEASR